MNITNCKLLVLVLIVSMTTHCLGQRITREVELTIIKNRDTILLSSNDIAKFIYNHDTLTKSISNGKLVVDSTVFIKPITELQLYTGNDTLKLQWMGDSLNYFKNRFVLDLPVPLKFVFHYYTNYKLGKEYYERLTVTEDKFKSMIVWNCNWCSGEDYFIETK